MFSSSLLAAALALVPSVHAMFILGHSHALTTDRLDPIVNPGALAGHVHTVVGSSAFGPEVTYDQLQSGNCTTAIPQVDHSNYWVPLLYYKDADKFTAVPVAFVNTYYLNRDGPKNKTITAFPNGLRMLAGTAYRTTFNASAHEDQAISYVCLDYTNGSSGPTPRFPTKNCKDGLRAQVMFPSCWDGVNLDSDDHKSHMAYPIQAVDSGDCPASHPVKLTTLFYEFAFSVNNFPGFGSDHWVFSTGSGDLGFHGDFISGWKREVLQAAMDQCTENLFQDLSRCPPLVPYLNEAKSSSCNLAPIVEEDVGFTKPLARLPGCNPTPAGSGAAKCVDLAAPAMKGFKPASPAAPHSASSAASSSSSAAAAATDVASSAVTSSSSSARPAPTSSVASPATSPAPTATPSSSAVASKTRSDQLLVGAPVTVGGPKQATPLPMPTEAHTCKRSNRDAAALAASAKHKRAVQHHARRSRAAF